MTVFSIIKTKDRLQDIKNNPENHKHDFDGLQRCCIIDGALDTMLIEAHSEYVSMGSNGGVACDVSSGPCACGAWH